MISAMAARAAAWSTGFLAARLYLSVYTVRAHLSAELGIRSRTQLTRRLGASG
jgi:hypothetical protein